METKPKPAFKSKISNKTIAIAVAVVLLAASVSLGAMYNGQLQKNKELIDQLSGADVTEKVEEPESEEAEEDETADEAEAVAVDSSATTADQIAGLQSQIEILEGEKENLQSKIELAGYYNEFFKYMTHVIDDHNGFTGWNDNEFKEADSRAQKTGDASFVAKVNWAWYDKSTAALDRVIGVWDATAAGIEGALDY